MTIRGALSDLDNLLKADDIPFYYKPSIKAVMDTIALSSSEKPNNSTTKNDLGIECISRDSAIKALDYDIDSFEFKSGVSKYMNDIAKLLNTIYEIQVNNIKALPSVTPQNIDYKAQYERLSQKAEIVISQLRADRDRLMSLPSVTPQEPRKCTWIKYDYRTMCPKEHIDVDNPYWRIPENRMETLKYCPYCGKEIEVEE